MIPMSLTPPSALSPPCPLVILCPLSSLPFRNFLHFNTAAPSADSENICDMFRGQLCAHLCVSVPGSYRCECRPGFVLGPDAKSCTLDPDHDRSGRRPAQGQTAPPAEDGR